MGAQGQALHPPSFGADPASFLLRKFRWWSWQRISLWISLHGASAVSCPAVELHLPSVWPPYPWSGSLKRSRLQTQPCPRRMFSRSMWPGSTPEERKPFVNKPSGSCMQVNFSECNKTLEGVGLFRTIMIRNNHLMIIIGFIISLWNEPCMSFMGPILIRYRVYSFYELGLTPGITANPNTLQQTNSRTARFNIGPSKIHEWKII